ncbi:type IV pilin protein [Delftia acidovorans]|uniref:type IV pilin protein n=1 Tax=Delftia acidovorans TaxID=80866 RepID=UPI003C6DAE78
MSRLLAPPSPMARQRPAGGRRDRGFTLIELMIVVAVVAILGAIAVPSYNEYIRRAHRADARAGLLQAQQWLERAATAMGVYPTALPAELTWSSDRGKRYTLGFAAGNTNAAYTLVATRRGSQAGDRCGDFTLTHTGTRGLQGDGITVAAPLVMECWNR